MDGANAGEREVSMQEGSAEAEARRIQPGGTSHRFRSCAARRPTDRLAEDSLMSLEMPGEHHGSWVGNLVFVSTRARLRKGADFKDQHMMHLTDSSLSCWQPHDTPSGWP